MADPKPQKPSRPVERPRPDASERKALGPLQRWLAPVFDVGPDPAHCPAA